MMQDPFSDLYAVLGVPRNVNEADLKRMFKRRALQTHPDKNPNNPDIVIEFRAVKRAFHVLSDEKERAAYDKSDPEAGKAKPKPGPAPAPKSTPVRRSSFDSKQPAPLSLMYPEQKKVYGGFSTGEYDVLRKFVFVGMSGMPKSKIMEESTYNPFAAEYKSTIGVDFAVKRFNHNGHRVKLQLWDTAGQERYSSLTSSYTRNASAFIVVMDASNIRSFEFIRFMLSKLRQDPENNCVVALVVDCERHTREVGEETIKSFCEEHGITVSVTINSKKPGDIREKMDNFYGQMLDAVDKKEDADILKEDLMIEGAESVLAIEGPAADKKDSLLDRVLSVFRK
jgi:small GTP-binding protein